MEGHARLPLEMAMQQEAHTRSPLEIALQQVYAPMAARSLAPPDVRLPTIAFMPWYLRPNNPIEYFYSQSRILKMCLRTRKGATHRLQVLELAGIERIGSALLRLKLSAKRQDSKMRRGHNQQDYGFREPLLSFFASGNSAIPMPAPEFESQVNGKEGRATRISTERHSPTDNTGNRGTMQTHKFGSVMRTSSPPENEAQCLPLVIVAARLLGMLKGFSDISFAKLVWRSVVPSTGSDGTCMERQGVHQTMGYRINKSEKGLVGPRHARVNDDVGTMYLTLATSVPQPWNKMSHLSRFWTYWGWEIN
ncbi:uncharacterized protein F5147DRAFT_809241 [Suillus discolor]|uniref:Uncharacterized protein n=1 Tax=Suillus discolor TaxID=1912936 RepID=A0A9P7F3G0_9AGAM|nr:uncharacterized protein F5147DRAFT_809241 [Suillus discolor]KAG2103486.1 hypothetical protein F5147DRAFT_809241 [Suillus discolor]